MTPTSPLHALAITAMLACATPLSAMAAEEQAPANQTAPSRVEEAFKAADNNHDQALSKDEAKTFPAISAQFSELDKNADGVLSYEEFQNGLKPATPY